MKVNNTKDPFANLDAKDLKIVSRMESATKGAEKASEVLNRAMADAYNAGLHTKAGFSNFGKWATAAMEAKGLRFGKSSAYKAVQIAEVRSIAPEANNLPDTVVAKIAKVAPLGDNEKTAAFVSEVVKAGGTVDAVEVVNGGSDADSRDPADRIAEDFAKRVVKLVRGDVKRAEAILGYASSEVKRLLLEASRSSK